MKIEEEKRIKLEKEIKENQEFYQKLLAKNQIEHQKRMDEIRKGAEKDLKKIEDDYKKWDEQKKLQIDMLNLNHQVSIQ